MNTKLQTILAPIIERTQNLLTSYQENLLKTKPIIAIAGGSGVGKSYFSNHLKKALEAMGYRIAIINQDGFSPYNSQDPHALINVDVAQARSIMQQVAHANGLINIPFRTRTKHPYSEQHPEPHTIEYTTIDFTNVDLIIFEGSLVLSNTKTCNLLDLSNFGIFIDASPEHIRQWKTEREQAKPTELQRPKEIFEQLLTKAAKVYQNYVLPTKKSATFVIYKKDKDQYTLAKQI